MSRLLPTFCRVILGKFVYSVSRTREIFESVSSIIQYVYCICQIHTYIHTVYIYSSINEGNSHLLYTVHTNLAWIFTKLYTVKQFLWEIKKNISWSLGHLKGSGFLVLRFHKYIFPWRLKSKGIKSNVTRLSVAD